MNTLRTFWHTLFLLTAAVATLPGRTSLEAAEGNPPIFSREIAPLIFGHCTVCHRPGEAAPFPLQSFSDVQKHGDLVGRTVASGQMPPWKAGQSDVPFDHNRQLSVGDRDLIARWITAGMPEGNPAETPSLPKFTPGWLLGDPDLVVKMSEPFVVPAEGPDVYRNFVVPLGLVEDCWVKAIEFRPSARSVVHHSLFFYETSGRARKLDQEDQMPGFGGGMGAMARMRTGGMDSLLTEQASGKLRSLFSRDSALAKKEARRKFEQQLALREVAMGQLGGWALGAQPSDLPVGLAYFVPKGADLVLATHFHPSGKAESERSTIGVYFAKGPTERKFTPIQLPPAFGAFKQIDIAPGEKRYVIEDSFVVPVDIEAFGVGAHAHYLGKSMKLSADLPNGKTLCLLEITDWDFAWQEQYKFANYVSLPKGTRLRSRITYDNSKENPHNPSSPPLRVKFGEESTNEMGSITLMVVAAKEPEILDLQLAYKQHFVSSISPTVLIQLMRDNKK